MEQKQNTGAIFKNDKKTSQNHPDYKGKINVEGKDFDVALWLKESSKGMKYFSVSVSEPYVQNNLSGASNQAQPVNAPVVNNDDDLPF